jgi:diamine N-acetyltransferase
MGSSRQTPCRGLGRAAIHALLDLFRVEPSIETVWISYVPKNEAARRLYAQLGFVETGLDDNGEMQARLVLAR